MIIALVFSFVILVIATRNVIQASISLACVAFVIVSVIGVMNMMGWELGEVESLAIVANIGLSVDYIVHLAADYTHSREETRSDKMRQAYRQMGVSILSGAITTMGCGVLLTVC